MASCKDCLKADVCDMAKTFNLEKANKMFDVDCEHFIKRGRLIELPCDVGTEVYLPQRNDMGDIEHYPITDFVFDGNSVFFVIDDENGYAHPIEIIGKDVFLNYSEAEVALKRVENHIKTFRTKAHLTQQELANKLGVSQQAITKWENGKSFPRSELLPAVASVLECNIEDLY